MNNQLALLSFCNVLAPNLPASPGTLGQDDQQQLLWGYPGVLWGTVTTVVGPGVVRLMDRLYNVLTLEDRLLNTDKVRDA